MLHRKVCHDCETIFFCGKDAKDGCREGRLKEGLCHCIECSITNGYLIEECPKYDVTKERVDEFVLQDL
jgi:hypothetical protein